MVSDTFVKITNRDIYNRIEKFIQANREEHEEILLKQKETNGKVKANRWMITSVISVLSSITVGMLLFTITRA